MDLSVERALSVSRGYVRSGALAAAEAVLRRTIARFPKSKRLKSELRELTQPGALGKDARASALVERGNAWWRNGRMDQAQAFFQSAMTRNPGQIDAAMGLAMVARAEGRTEDAVAQYRRILSDNPGLVEPYRYITEMRETQPDDGWIETLSKALEAAKTNAARASLSFALGKALADIGAVDAAFTAFRIANEISRQGLSNAPRAIIADLEGVSLGFGQQGTSMARGEAMEPPFADAPRPIFILGLPRTGSTLVERILAQHSQVVAGGERIDLWHALQEAGYRGGRPDAEMVQHIRQSYYRRLPVVGAGTDWMTDKMPWNARWIGVICQAFPEAKIIETRRHPVAVGWSLYRCSFASLQMSYTFDLEEIADYITAHDRMMQFWEQDCPEAVLPVDYEQLCAAPQVEIRKLLRRLDLPLEPGCLSPEQYEGSVQTASFEQVRRPIYDRSSECWRAYTEHLAPLLPLENQYRRAA